MQGFMAPYGYDPVQSLNQFRKDIPGGFHCVIFSASPYPDGLLLEAHVGLRNNAVEDTVFPLLNGLPGFQPDSMTLVAPLGRLFGEHPERFSLQSPADEQQALARIQLQLERRGFSFLRQIQTLRALDELFNAHPTAPLRLVHNQFHRCFRGLAIAKLNQRGDFMKLAGIYRNQLYRLGAPEYVVDHFEKLSHILHSYSVN